MRGSALITQLDRAADQMFVRNYHLAVAFLLFLPLIFLGYGEEPDSYIIVRAGKRFLLTWSYNPSRRPGAAAYEIPEAFLNRLGGSVLSNFGSLLASMAFLACFTWILKRFEIPQRHRLIWGVILLPMYWNNSTVTQDYVWALCFAAVGLMLALRGTYGWAGLAWGISIGSRATSVILVASFLLFLFLERSSPRKGILVAAVIAMLSGIACFLPMLSSSTPFAFLQGANWGDEQMWTWYLRLGRFVYKNIYLWGLPAAITLLVGLYFCIREYRLLLHSRWKPLLVASAFIVLAHEALFMLYPMKPEYLLPTVPFVLIILGIGLQRRPRVLAVFVGFIAAYCVISIDIARPDVRWRARGATFGIFPEKGRLLQTISERLENRHCATIECVADVNAKVLRRIWEREGRVPVMF